MFVFAQLEATLISLEEDNKVARQQKRDLQDRITTLTQENQQLNATLDLFRSTLSSDPTEPLLAETASDSSFVDSSLSFAPAQDMLPPVACPSQIYGLLFAATASDTSIVDGPLSFAPTQNTLPPVAGTSQACFPQPLSKTDTALDQSYSAPSAMVDPYSYNGTALDGEAVYLDALFQSFFSNTMT